MKLLLVAMGGVLFTLLWLDGRQAAHIEDLTARVEALKIKNASIADEHWRFKGINDKALRDSLFLYPMPEAALKSIRRVENGTAVELGFHGKHWPLCLYPEDEWQYLEAARLVSDMACQYAFDKRHRDEFVFRFLGPRYNRSREWPKKFLLFYGAYEAGKLKP